MAFVLRGLKAGSKKLAVSMWTFIEIVSMER